MLIVSFVIYDVFVQKRNSKVVAVAAKTNEIVASLFPEAVRDRLFEDKKENNKKASGAKESDEVMIQKFLTGNAEMDDEVDEEEDFMYKSRPIADLYTATTIMFADIAGFTAWSSTREPAQVFTLLETFYKAFDGIASRRGIFKVEVRHNLWNALNSFWSHSEYTFLCCCSLFSQTIGDCVSLRSVSFVRCKPGRLSCFSVLIISTWLLPVCLSLAKTTL